MGTRAYLVERYEIEYKESPLSNFKNDIRGFLDILDLLDIQYAQNDNNALIEINIKALLNADLKKCRNCHIENDVKAMQELAKQSPAYAKVNGGYLLVDFF